MAMCSQSATLRRETANGNIKKFRPEKQVNEVTGNRGKRGVGLSPSEKCVDSMWLSLTQADLVGKY